MYTRRARYAVQSTCPPGKHRTCISRYAQDMHLQACPEHASPGMCRTCISTHAQNTSSRHAHASTYRAPCVPCIIHKVMIMYCKQPVMCNFMAMALILERFESVVKHLNNC